MSYLKIAIFYHKAHRHLLLSKTTHSSSRSEAIAQQLIMADNNRSNEVQGKLPPSSGQQPYRARGCRGGAYRKGRTYRSKSYNMRRDQERKVFHHNHDYHHQNAYQHQENDPQRINRRHSPPRYHQRQYHRNHYHHHNYHHNNYHHNHPGQNYHGRTHPSNFKKDDSANYSHESSRSRTLSILPSGNVLPDGDDIIDDDTYEPTLSDDSDGTSIADKQQLHPSPSVLKPILPTDGLDSVSHPAAEFSTAETTKASRTVIAPLSNVAVKESGEIQALNNFSFFALSPSSFLRGKKTTSNRQQHF